MEMLNRPSPNCKPREGQVKYIILHGTWMADDEEALARLCDPEAEVSCHYFISREGVVYRLVNECDVAWHAGVSHWGDESGLNASSIGIELSHPEPSTVEAPHYTEIQYQRLEQLMLEILSRHPVAPKNVLAHSDIATDRKNDPGGFFDWGRLYHVGLAAPLAPEVPYSVDALRKVGYHGADDDILKAHALRQ